MRINTAKRKMMEGKVAFGASAGLGSPLAAEHLSLAGFDLVLVDHQHGEWDPERAMLAFHSICLGPATPMVRVGCNDYYLIGNMLDRGALGVVVPMVNSPEDARAAAQAARYPPMGSRSAGPFGTALHGDDYLQAANEEVFLAVQIETQEAVAQAEAILSTDGVDACWIGPTDLSFSMGVERGSDEHEAAIQRVLEVCRKIGKIPGIAAGPDFEQRIAQGFRFVTNGSDAMYVRNGAQEALRRIEGRS